MTGQRTENVVKQLKLKNTKVTSESYLSELLLINKTTYKYIQQKELIIRKLI